LLFIGEIPQNPQYHQFADRRQLHGIFNFYNVISNLPFLAVGLLGLLRYPKLSHIESTRGYLVMCIGVVFVGFGSAYYHYAPTNETLLWDRLPMTVAFMAFLSLVLNERVLLNARPYLVWALVFIGATTVFYWSWTESLGKGDLRPYILVQFLPMLLIPPLLVMFKPKYLGNKLLFAAFGLYIAAKAFEHFDKLVFSVMGILGGHTLKHLLASIAVLCLIYAIPTRRIVANKSFTETYLSQAP